MPDLVYVRANAYAPISEGGAVSFVPNALITPSGNAPSGVYAYHRDTEITVSPSGSEEGFAVGVLATRFRNRTYYTDPDASGLADNPAQPTF